MVIAKTDERGPHAQFVYVLRCGRCGHEYGSYGGDIFHRKCPACQELSTDTPRERRTMRPAEGPPIK